MNSLLHSITHSITHSIRCIVTRLCSLAGPTVVIGKTIALNHDPAIHHSIVEGGTPAPRVDTGSVIELSDGTLLMAYQRTDDDSQVHDHAVMRVWTRVSSDGGHTWVAPLMRVDISPEDLTVGMPALLRLPSGDILMICSVHHSVSSTSMRQFRSRDEGRTFEEEPAIWKRSEGLQLQGGANSLVLLQSGRILLPLMFGLPDKDTQKLASGFYVSDDSGCSWRQFSVRIELPRRGAMEPSVAELQNGDLVVSLRTQLGGPYLSHSFDSGETWTVPEPAGWDPVIKGPTLQGGESCTVLRRIPGTNTLLLLWNKGKYVIDTPNYRGHFGKRTTLTAAVSSDAGKTWVIIGDIVSEPNYGFTNLSCIFTSDGRAVITYYCSNRITPWPGPFNPTITTLRGAVIKPLWFKAAIAQSIEVANTPPQPYLIPT